jgi:hypothetical protein
MRVLLGLLIAPLAPGVIALLGAVVAFPFETRTFALASALGYPVALVVGAPLYVLFRRKGWLKAWQVVLAGGAVGMFIPIVIALAVLVVVALLGAGFTLPVAAEAAHKYLGLVLVGALSGIACASVFWLIAIFGSTVEQRARTHAN